MSGGWEERWKKEQRISWIVFAVGFVALATLVYFKVRS